MTNILIKNELINNFRFIQAMNKLSNASFKSPKTAYTIGYVKKKIDVLVRDGREVFQKVAVKYAKLDDNGNLIPETNEAGNPIPGTFLFKDESSKDLFEKESKEFMAIEHEINREKMDVNLLEGVELSANDILALEPLLCGLED